MITRSITRPVTSPIARAVTAAYGAWNPRALFASGEQGVVYDPNDLSTLFQDAAGTTPVTAAGQPVGLMLDKRLGLVRGPELIPAPLNLLGGGWITLGTLSQVNSDGFANTSGAGAGRAIAVGEAGRKYAVAVQYSKSDSTTEVRATFNGGSPVVEFTSSSAQTGTLSGILYGGGFFYIRLAGNCTITILSVSVRELPGNHAFQPTAASRPILRQNATTGAYYLETDGSDDWMSTSAIDFTGTDKVSVFAGVRKLSDASIGMVLELSSNANTTAGAFYLSAPDNALANNFGFKSRGSLGLASSTVPAAAPIAAVVSGSGSISGDLSIVRVNGVNGSGVTTDHGVGNFGNHPLYLFRRGGTTLPFNGHFYGLTIVNRLTTAAETRNVERMLAQRTGVTLS